MLFSESSNDYAVSLKDIIKVIMGQDARVEVLACTSLITLLSEISDYAIEESIVFKDGETETKFIEKIWQKIYAKNYNKRALDLEKPWQNYTLDAEDFLKKIANIFEDTYNKYNPLMKKLQEEKDNLITGHQTMTKHTSTRTLNRMPFNDNNNDVIDSQNKNESGIITESNVNTLEKLKHYEVTYTNYENEWVKEFDFLFESFYNDYIEV